jgi:hypothetical protein
VLRADRRVVQAGAYGMSLPDLAFVGLQDVAQVAVQDAGPAPGERGPVFSGLEALLGG